MPTSRRATSWFRPMRLGVWTVGVVLGVWLAALLPRAGIALAASAECLSTPPGDVNGDDRLTPGDALLAFKHFLLLAVPPLDECQQRRANVSNPTSNDITPADALCLFRAFLGLPSCLDNRAPVLTNPGAQRSAVGTSVSLPIVASDPDGTPLTFSATNLPPDLRINSTTGIITGTIAATAAASSPYTVTLKVSDGALSTSVEFTWTVPAPPVAEVLPHEDQFASPNRETGKFPAVTLDGSGSKSPSGHALTYRWTFTVEPPDGRAALSAPDAKITTFAPDDAGMYTLTLTVQDAQGGTASKTVVVNAQAPTDLAPGDCGCVGKKNGDQVPLPSKLTNKDGKPVKHWPVTYTLLTSGAGVFQSPSGSSLRADRGGRAPAATQEVPQQGTTTTTVFTDDQGIAIATLLLQSDDPVRTVTAAAEGVPEDPVTFKIIGLETPGALAVTATGALVLIDTTFAVVVDLDIDQKSRTGTLVSGRDQGTGDPFALGNDSTACRIFNSQGKIEKPVALAIDPGDGSLVLVDCDHRRVLRVEPTTGDRTVLSGCADEQCTPSKVQGGGVQAKDMDIVDLAVLPTTGSIVVVDRINGVVRVTPRGDRKGERNIVSGRGIGNGEPFAGPSAVAVETDNTLVVLDAQRMAVLRVYLSATAGHGAGDREVVSGLGFGSGDPRLEQLVDLKDIAVAPGKCPLQPAMENQCVFVLSSTAIVQVNPMTGERRLISGCVGTMCQNLDYQGRGPELQQARALAIRLVKEQGTAKGKVTLVVADINREAVLQIDPMNGDRLIISEPNDAPTAKDDQPTTSQGEAMSIDVLANDTDADQTQLRIVAVTQGKHGTVTITPGKVGNLLVDKRSVTYTPDRTFHGTDTFMYTVIDRDGAQATASVTVTVEPTRWGDPHFMWNKAPWSGAGMP